MEKDLLTYCDETIKAFLGRKPVYKTTAKNHRPCVYFDVSFGVNDSVSGKLGTWRHCIAYDNLAESLRNLNAGEYLRLTGYIVTNYMYDDGGKKVIINGVPSTQEYLIVQTAIPIERDKKPAAKQLSMVEREG